MTQQTKVSQTEFNTDEVVQLPVNTMPSNRKDMFTLAPRTLSEAMEYANLIADSGMVPKNFQGRPADVLVAVQMGVELGLPPTQALQNIAIVNGRPSLWGDAVLAIVKASPLCQYVREYFDSETCIATCVTKRLGDDEEVTRTFSYEDAKLAGLWSKQGPWTQYPQRMAQMRARSWAVRDAFPDLLRGIAVREEQMDIEKDVTPAQQTKEANRTDSLLSRLKNASIKDQSQDVELAAIDLVLEKIANATSEAQLIDVVEMAKDLPQSAQDKARKAYKDRLHELRIKSDSIENEKATN